MKIGLADNFNVQLIKGEDTTGGFSSDPLDIWIVFVLTIQPKGLLVQVVQPANPPLNGSLPLGNLICIDIK